MKKFLDSLYDSKLFNWPYVRENMYLAVQMPDNNFSLVKKRLLNLDLVIRVEIERDCENYRVSALVTKSLLKSLEVPEEDAWKFAIENSRKCITVKNLAEIVEPLVADISEINEPKLFSVVTSCNMHDGAAGLYFPEIFRDWCDSNDKQCCYILPSSVHEVIIVSRETVDIEDVQYMANMVKDINEKIVDPRIRLYPVVYKYDRITDTITIVAKANDMDSFKWEE